MAEPGSESGVAAYGALAIALVAGMYVAAPAAGAWYAVRLGRARRARSQSWAPSARRQGRGAGSPGRRGFRVDLAQGTKCRMAPFDGAGSDTAPPFLLAAADDGEERERPASHFAEAHARSGHSTRPQAACARRRWQGAPQEHAEPLVPAGHGGGGGRPTTCRSGRRSAVPSFASRARSAGAGAGPCMRPANVHVR